jgi:hypothetical protein
MEAMKNAAANVPRLSLAAIESRVEHRLGNLPCGQRLIGAPENVQGVPVHGATLEPRIALRRRTEIAWAL